MLIAKTLTKAKNKMIKVTEILSKYDVSTLKKAKVMVIIFFALSFANFIYDIIIPLIIFKNTQDIDYAGILFFSFSFLGFFWFFRALQIAIQNKEQNINNSK